MENTSKAGLPLPAEVRAAIERVVDYLWDDERGDYVDSDPDAQRGHVYESLREIQAWLNDMRPDPTCPGKKPFSVRGEGWSL